MDSSLIDKIQYHLRGTDCRVYCADIKVRLEKSNCFYYPDLLVACDLRDRGFTQKPESLIKLG